MTSPLSSTNYEWTIRIFMDPNHSEPENVPDVDEPYQEYAPDDRVVPIAPLDDFDGVPRVPTVRFALPPMADQIYYMVLKIPSQPTISGNMTL